MTHLYPNHAIDILLAGASAGGRGDGVLWAAGLVLAGLVLLLALVVRRAYLRELREDRDQLCAALNAYGSAESDVLQLSLRNEALQDVAEACDRLLPRLQTTIAMLEWSARHDPMTDLLNSAAFKLAAQSALAARQGQCSALIVMGINQLKKVNDSLGHAGGDQLLCAVADRLRMTTNAWREARIESEPQHEVFEPLLARLGGDEFAILMPCAEGRTEIDRFVQRLQRVIGDAIHVGVQSLRIKLSIGIALAEDHNNHYDELLAAADSAMSNVKAEGEGGYLFYSSEMRRAADELLARELDLRHALERGEFCLHYQPQLNMHTGQIDSVEALIRWNHPTRGLVYPGDFIPFAETYGLIDDIGDWVMLEAVRTAARWDQEGMPLRVSVNVSPMQLYRVELIPMIRACLTRFQLRPELLEIEITEAAIMRNEEFSLERIEGLRRDGVTVAMDDFGTGYSNLSQLMSLPMDRLKLDRSLVDMLETDPRKRTVAAGIIAMARNLGFEVVAEGVETDEQIALLRAAGADYVQGYAFARPIPEAALIERLQQTRNSPDVRVA
ncbi:EAL domain-containing protein [Novosphingobium sp. FSY-8]|uniref:EAL domain-containing protein n=1 Tax=Novosphingobium ovatum TaxID=1908523 RepID=A0ABW9XF32_9SPHN|nr:EAL domain-containing protein [Novosphingobium ovatum]NBC37114.1 EAL domain-containing protein [Novosphingobium ovatum]